ncbi:MAG: ATP-binding protein [Candidatus Gorgyraea atricola]|nr:ATP-binding protein [Candidatus Gorgyraea atricola]
MKISQKLILGFLAVAALVALIGYLSIDVSQDALQKHIGENSVSLASEIIDKIDRDIYSKIETFEEYSKHLLLQQMLLESNQAFKDLDDIQTYITTKDEEWVSAPKETITPFMQELIDNRLSGELREKINFYEEKYGYRVFGEVFVTNQYGVNVALTGKTSDYRQDDEAWWLQAKDKGLFIRDVKYDESADLYSTDIAVRVEDSNGDFIGVIKVVLNIEEAINIIKSVAPSEQYRSRYFKLVNKNGRLVHFTGEKKNISFFKDISNQEFFKGMKGDKGFFIESEHSEGKRLFAYAHSRGYRDFKGLGWILIVEHETGEIFASVIRLRNAMLATSFILTILAVLIGALISRSILKPLRKLMHATINIGKGNLDTKVEIKSKDEIAALAIAFNSMTENLKRTTTSIYDLNREIAERKKAESDLNKAYERLKETQDQLIQAEKMAAMGTLSAGMAHEINNPLMGVMLLAGDLASEKKKKSKEYKALSQIEGGLKRISGVVSKLLVFSRKEELVLKKEDINDVIESAIPFVFHEFKINKIELVKNYGKDLPGVDVSVNALQQVILNLLLNAKDAVLDLKSKKISIESYLENDMVKVKIKDKGQGIKKEHLKKIFDPFFTTKPIGRGLGMGMSIVKNIMDQHRGKIEIYSEEKKGTEAVLSLPC